MSREEESPTTAGHPTSAQDRASPQYRGEALADAPGHSGSRWELAFDTAEPYEAAGDPTVEHGTPLGAAAAPAGTTWWHHEPPAPAGRPRRRGLRVAARVGAAVVLAGGGFAVGHAVGDSGPSGPGGGVGHHRFHDGGGFGAPARPGQGRTGQGQAGQNTFAGPSAILGGLFT